MSRINITELEKLLNHYRAFYEMAIMWAFLMLLVNYHYSVDTFNTKMNAICLLVLVWFNHRRVNKIKAQSKKFILLFTDDTDEVIR